MPHTADAGHDDGEHYMATIPAGRDTYQRSERSGWKSVLSYIPGFFYVLALYIASAYVIADPNAVQFSIGPYHVTWNHVIFLIAFIVVMAEIFRVSKPGVDNSGEVYAMTAFAALQLFFIALAVAYPDALFFMRSTENLILMVMNAIQAFVALRINARSLVRTIAGGNVSG
jgi:hypothetical protein